ncbi:pseudouridine-5'-phosphatase [Folsomia candida]|nr:pseudouridine-5'-phosphatase [Folsomia candida]
MIEKFHPITHVIFDMDGLLLDTEPKYEKAISTICENFGSKYTLEAKLGALGRTATDAANAVITKCNLPISCEEFLDLMESQYPSVFQHVDMMPGAEKLVSHFAQAQIPQAIATSSKTTTFRLKSKGKEDFFGKFSHIVIGSDDPEVVQGKPHPDIFHVAAKRFPNPPESMQSVLVFEDSINGVKAGLAAGMQVVWVPDPCLDITSQNATQIIKSLEDFNPQHFHLPKWA